MNSDELIDIIGNTDYELVQAAAEAKVRRSKRKWVRILAAAFVCIVLFVSFELYRKAGIGEPTPPTREPVSGLTQSLPPINAELSLPAFGMEAFIYNDISERLDGNPWSEDMNIETLPVYKNLVYSSQAGSFFLTDDEMTAIAQKAAQQLNEEIVSSEFDYLQKTAADSSMSEYIGMPATLEAYTQSLHIIVTGSGAFSVWYRESKLLPEHYRYAFNSITKSQSQELAAYLLQEFADIVQPDNPVIRTGGEYDYEGNRHMEFLVYEGSDDIVQSILNCSLTGIRFTVGEDGSLNGVSVYNSFNANGRASTEKLGDYPIITAVQAREKLLAGNYYSTVVPENIENRKINENNIAAVELVYKLTGEDTENQMYVPYYLFYVQLFGDSQDTQKKTFGNFTSVQLRVKCQLSAVFFGSSIKSQ